MKAKHPQQRKYSFITIICLTLYFFTVPQTSFADSQEEQHYIEKYTSINKINEQFENAPERLSRQYSWWPFIASSSSIKRVAYRGYGLYKDKITIEVWREQGETWISISPDVFKTAFVCSTSFSIKQGFTIYDDVKLETRSGTSQCSTLPYTLLPQVYKLTFWNFVSNPPDLSKSFTLYFNGGETMYYLYIPTTISSPDPKPDPEKIVWPSNAPNSAVHTIFGSDAGHDYDSKYEIHVWREQGHIWFKVTPITKSALITSKHIFISQNDTEFTRGFTKIMTERSYKNDSSGYISSHITIPEIFMLFYDDYVTEQPDVSKAFTINDNYPIGDCSLYVPADSYSYYIPYFKTGSGFWTGLGLTNRNQEVSADLQATVYGVNGDLLATENKTIPAHGQDSFVVGSQLNNNGWVQINSNQPMSGLAFLGSWGTPLLMADIPFSSNLSTCMIVPHIAQDNSWDTTILICNPNNETISITLKYVDKAGVEQGTQNYTLLAYGSGEYLLSTVFNDKIPLAGSIEISSSKGIAAFALYSDRKNGGTYYAGINADSCD